MKPKSTLHAFLLACGSLLAISCLHAAPLTWDPGATGGSDGSGDWDSGTNWWDGASAAAWTSGDDATIGSGGGTTGGSGDTITLGAATAANSVTFEAFNFQYTLNGATLSTNSINTNTGSGQAYFNTMSIDAGASPLVIGGTAAPNPDRTIANVKMKASVTGTAGLTKNGPGVLWWETNPAYTGTTTINGGVYRTQNDPNTALPSGNIILNGGQVGGYWNQNLTNRTLGTDFSIPGGESGFTQHGGASLTVELSSDAVLQWGDADFNPSVLDMMSIQSNNSARVLMKNPIDLNGAQRTIRVNQGNYTGVRAEFEDEFSNSDGVNPAGITKTGPGLLHLNAPDGGGGSDYDSLIVNGGFVKFGSSWNNTWSGENLPGTANVEIQDGVLGGYFSLDVNLGTGPGEWQITGGTSGINMLQSDRVDITFNSGAEIVWGSASFAPDVLVLNAENPQALPSSVARLNNPLDLNGADRTVFTDSTAAAPVNAPNDGAFGQIIGRGGVLNGDIRNTGATAGLIKTGAGTIALGGTNTYDGGTTISEGGLYFPKIAAMPANGVVTVNNGTTLIVGLGGAGEWTTGTSGNGTLGGLLAGDGGQSPSTVSYVGTTNLGLAVSGSQTYSGVISSAGNLAVLGGSLTLDQNNTFTGDLIVGNGSTLVLSGDNFGAAGDVRIDSGYLDAATANLSGGGLTFNSAGSDAAIWVTSGSLAPTLGSANDVFWNGNGGFAATSSALTVSPNAGAQIDWSAATGFNGKQLQLGSPGSTASVEITNDIDIDSNRNIRLFNNSASNDDIATLSGAIDGGGSNRNLTVEGSGTLVLSGANDFGNGILYLGNSGASSVVRATEGTGLPTAAKLYFNNGVLESSGSFTRNIGTGNGEVYWNNKGGFAANGGALTVNLEGGIALNWGDTNAGFRNQDPLYFGSDTADNVVTFENEIILNANRNIQVTDNPDTNADYAVISGVISETGGVRVLDKEGDGTLVLEGANTYTGTTNVNGGTLIIDGSTSTGLIDVRNGSGRALGGTGSIGGAVTLENNTGLTFDLITAPGGHDSLDVADTLTFEIDSELTITSNGGASTGTYTLVSTVNGISGSVPATVNLPAGWTADAPAISGNDLVINITSTGGGGPGPVDHFVISAISSPQTVGTPITGITITAEDVSNATATGFTGTVTFGGTGGFTGTSASFTAGVLSGVSVTPTVAGSSLTFTVDDGSSHTGSTTITTIQTQYAFWSGGAAFDDDANGDGVNNGLAFLLGAANPNVSALDKLPTVTQSSGDLVLSFNCLPVAARGTATLNVEHSSDLGISDAWAAAEVPDTTGGPVNGVSFVVGAGPVGPPALNSVTATIDSAEAGAGKLFGRLHGENP